MADTTPLLWTTTEAVGHLTGVTVDDATLLQAQGIIELKTGVLIEQSPALGGRDAAWIARAVGYQAAFMFEHPDLFSRMAVDAAGHDGESMSGRSDYMTVAPLAKSAMRRLSWKGTRSTSHERAADTNDEDETDGFGRPLKWEPMSR